MNISYDKNVGGVNYNNILVENFYHLYFYPKINNATHCHNSEFIVNGIIKPKVMMHVYNEVELIIVLF